MRDWTDRECERYDECLTVAAKRNASCVGCPCDRYVPEPELKAEMFARFGQPMAELEDNAPGDYGLFRGLESKPRPVGYRRQQ